MNLQTALRTVYAGMRLSREQAREVFTSALSGEADPAVLGAFLITLARRREIRAIRDGEVFDRSCEAPSADGDLGEIRAIWTDFERFAAGSLVVAAHAQTFEAWAAHLAGRRTGLPAVCGLSDVAALLFPGRLAHRRENRVLEFCASDPERARDAEPTPENVREALGELTRRFLALDDAVIGAIAGGVRGAGGLRRSPSGTSSRESSSTLAWRASCRPRRRHVPRRSWSWCSDEGGGGSGRRSGLRWGRGVGCGPEVPDSRR